MKLAIVGASARSACYSALRDGFGVVAVDQFADRDLVSVCEVATLGDWDRDLPDWLRDSNADAWMYVGGLENRHELVDELSVCKPLLGTSADVLRFIRDPVWLASHCEQWGVAMPETRSSLPSHRSEERWLRKPRASGGGIGIELIGIENSDGTDVVYQRYLSRVRSWSAVFCVSSRSALLLGVTQQLVGEPWLHGSPHGYCGSLVTGSDTFDSLQPTVQRLGNMLHSAGVKGLVGVDLVENESGVWLVEVNPRYTASVELLESLSGTSAISRHVAACVEATIHPAAAMPPQYFGKAVLFAEHDRIITESFSDWALTHRIDGDGWIADIPEPGTKIGRGEPILTLFAREREDPISQLRRLSNVVEASLEELGC